MWQNLANFHTEWLARICCLVLWTFTKTCSLMSIMEKSQKLLVFATITQFFASLCLLSLTCNDKKKIASERLAICFRNDNQLPLISSLALAFNIWLLFIIMEKVYFALNYLICKESFSVSMSCHKLKVAQVLPKLPSYQYLT